MEPMLLPNSIPWVNLPCFAEIRFLDLEKKLQLQLPDRLIQTRFLYRSGEFPTRHWERCLSGHTTSSDVLAQGHALRARQLILDIFRGVISPADDRTARKRNQHGRGDRS